jgi:hypothetical protein
MKTIAILLASALLGGAANAQDQNTAVLDGKTITVKASAPSGKRVVASLQTPADIAFKGIRVPKGSYTVYVLTDGPQWVLTVNKATAAKAATYDPKLDLGKVNMTMGKAAAAAPACKVTVTKSAALAARVQVEWNGTTGYASFHLDRGGADSEW